MEGMRDSLDGSGVKFIWQLGKIFRNTDSCRDTKISVEDFDGGLKQIGINLPISDLRVADSQNPSTLFGKTSIFYVPNYNSGFFHLKCALREL